MNDEETERGKRRTANRTLAGIGIVIFCAIAGIPEAMEVLKLIVTPGVGLIGLLYGTDAYFATKSGKS